MFFIKLAENILKGLIIDYRSTITSNEFVSEIPIADHNDQKESVSNILIPIFDDEINPLAFIFANKRKLKLLYTTNNTYFIENQEVDVLVNENINLNLFTKSNMTLLHYQSYENNIIQDKRLEIDTFLKIMNAYEYEY